jgi:glucokinase
MTAVLGFDLGGTRLKSAAVDGAAVHDLRAITIADGQALQTLLDTAQRLQRDHPCHAVGLSVPGLVDNGRLVSLPGKHPGLEGTDLARALTRRLGVPALVVNDALAYGAGESAAGAARDAHRAVVVTIGTGVGVAAFERGSPLGDGVFGGGILGGQIPIASDSDHVDTSGRRGTIEALCAAQRLVDGADGAFATVEQLVAAAAGAHPRAIAAVERWRGHLVAALTALAHAHAPDVIVVGGGPMVAGTRLLDGVEERLAARLFRGYTVRVRLAELGDAAALVGVAHLAARALVRPG